MFDKVGCLGILSFYLSCYNFSSSYLGICLERSGFTNLILFLLNMSAAVGLFLASTWSIPKIRVLRSLEYGPFNGGNDPFRILRANNGNEFA